MRISGAGARVGVQMSTAVTIKTCSVCNIDLSQNKRVKDSRGNYYCQSCAAVLARSNKVIQNSAAAAVVASAQAADPLLFPCRVCQNRFAVDDVYSEADGRTICKGCWTKLTAPAKPGNSAGKGPSTPRASSARPPLSSPVPSSELELIEDDSPVDASPAAGGLPDELEPVDELPPAVARPGSSAKSPSSSAAAKPASRPVNSGVGLVGKSRAGLPEDLEPVDDRSHAAGLPDELEPVDDPTASVVPADLEPLSEELDPLAFPGASSAADEEIVTAVFKPKRRADELFCERCDQTFTKRELTFGPDGSVLCKKCVRIRAREYRIESKEKERRDRAMEKVTAGTGRRQSANEFDVRVFVWKRTCAGGVMPGLLCVTAGIHQYVKNMGAEAAPPSASAVFLIVFGVVVVAGSAIAFYQCPYSKK